jgi:hypothetical protein
MHRRRIATGGARPSVRALLAALLGKFLHVLRERSTSVSPAAFRTTPRTIHNRARLGRKGSQPPMQPSVQHSHHKGGTCSGKDLVLQPRKLEEDVLKRGLAHREVHHPEILQRERC